MFSGHCQLNYGGNNCEIKYCNVNDCQNGGDFK